MWRILRPDALAVLGDDLARASLRRYFSVMDGKLPARFLICKKVPVKVKPSAAEEELWKAHEYAMNDFRKLLSEVDGGRLNIDDLGVPEQSLLDLKVEISKRILRSCHFCERRCGVDRTSGGRGVCGVGESSRVASEFMHYGEEPELVPSYTIFFNGCTFKCQFCQNWDISQYPESGVEVSPRTLARLVEGARKEGARNVNWVGGEPTEHLHTILCALNECRANIPSVWNSNMYCSVETMRLLSGVTDVYLTDFKYGNDECALRYSKVKDYWRVITRNHKLAHADAEVIIRHLVLPGGHTECCTKPIFHWISQNLGKTVRVNCMFQYRPCYHAEMYEELNRRLNSEEIRRSLELAREAGLENVIT
jgi:putative pyruvate formate lyase activating enzyme